MGTGLDSLTSSRMDRKIPVALWKSEILKLVSEAPRAVSVDCRDDWSHSSPDEDIGSRPLVLMSSSSGSTASTASSENFLHRIPSNRHQSDEKLDCNAGSYRRCTPPDIQFPICFNGSELSVPRRTSTDRTEEVHSNQDASWEHPSLMDFSSEENPFGKTFHGYLSQAQTSQLLQNDGQFLVRKKDPSDDDFILSFRFCGQVKNFLLSVEETTGFLYMGEKGKSYPTLQELVQEGLITLYLDQKAGSYIDLMCSIARFHKTQSSAVSGAQLTNGISQSLTRPNNPSSLHSNGRLRKNSISPSPTLSSTVSRSSVERRRKSDLKSHSFQLHTFQGLSTCQICQNFLWGLLSQGLQCNDCKFSVHESCVEKVTTDCEPKIEQLHKVFGQDLTMLVKVARGGRPFVLEKCIEEIEQRGLRVEGIYRVSGSKELIERLKALFEKEKDLADLSGHLDIHSICCLVKLFLRLLPQPLITAEVFQKFLIAKGPLTPETLRRVLRKLPMSHQVTLRYLLQHLHRVTQNSDQNKMTAFNLSSVFTPSIICPTEISLNTLKIGTATLEMMIANFPVLYPTADTKR